MVYMFFVSSLRQATTFKKHEANPEAVFPSTDLDGTRQLSLVRNSAGSTFLTKAEH